MDTLQRLQASLDVTFRDPRLLQQALVHRSYLNEAAESSVLASNERLEFLGDAVLGLIVTEELYHRYPSHAEGQLTEMRAQLVRGATLGQVAERLDLGAFLVLGRGEEQSGGRGRSINLGRALEALLGAVYLDGGFDTTRRLVLKLLAAEFLVLGIAGVGRDAKSSLQQYAQATLRVTPEYVTVSSEGPEHEREFVVEVRLQDEKAGVGRGRSKRQAQQAAAADALSAWSARADDAAATRTPRSGHEHAPGPGDQDLAAPDGGAG